MGKISIFLRALSVFTFLAFLHYEIKLASLTSTDYSHKKVAVSSNGEFLVDSPSLKWFKHFRDVKLQRKAAHMMPTDSAADMTTLREQIMKDLRDSLRQEMQSVELGNRSMNDLLLERGGKPIRTLIVATWRSGSSFLGEILRSHPGTYYLMEPLIHLCSSCQIRNGTLAERAVATLRNFYECKHNELENNDIERIIKKGKHRKRNVRLWNFCRIKPRVCWDANFHSNACKAFPIQTIKVTRVRLHVAQRMLEDASLNLKILYLVRDPRAIFNSRFEHDWCLKDPDCYDPSILCTDLTKEYYVSNQLQQHYPSRFMTITYEALAADVFNKTKTMFKFIGLNYHREVQKFLESHTKSNAGNAYSTFRDTKASASHWLKEWASDLDVIRSIQNSCVEAMTLWGYKNVTENDLIKLQFR